MIGDIVSRIDQRLKALGMSAAHASVASGLSEDAIRNMRRSALGKSTTRAPNMRTLAALADTLQTSVHWLQTGKDISEASTRPPSVRIMGYVGAGAVIDPIANLADQEFPEDISLPLGDEADALIVKGDSQWPRFMDGEVILVARKASQPEDLVNCYAMVQTLDGRVLIKIIRRSGRPDEWLLESHNAPPEITRLLLAREYLGTLSPGRRIALPARRPPR